MTWVCSTCDVPLCKRPGFSEQWADFFLFLVWPGQCCAEAQSIKVSVVRSHGNWHAPQSCRSNALSAETAGGSMVPPPSVSRNDNDDEYIPAGNSSGDDDDESSPESNASRRRTCSTITIPERRTRRSRLMEEKVVLSVKSDLAAI